MIHGRPERAPEGPWDLVVVGGGAYGAFTALEAARRGLRPLLLERDDFGGATSGNSLRIVHGGLRYLQTLDLARYRRSVAERRWLLRSFPGLVRPLRCVMPLYGRGLRRRPVLRAALALDHLLSPGRNRGLSPDRRVPRGEVVGAEATADLVPEARTGGLRGGAVWHDAEMVDSARLLMETLRWATARGAVCLNYTEAEEAVVERGEVRGVAARDRLADRRVECRAGIVINCAGPWAPEVAGRLDREVPGLYRPSLAFNLLLDRPLRGDVAVAARPPGAGARTYFVRPWKGRTLAGTFHAPRPPGTETADPRPREVEGFLDDLRRALPGLDVGPGDVRRVLAGLLPVREAGTVDLETSPEIVDHGAGEGPVGLFSVRGVKYTTARRVAEEVLRRACAARGRELSAPPDPAPPEPRARLTAAELTGLARDAPERARSHVEAIVRGEAVTGVDDLVERRTEWGLAAADPGRIREIVAPWVADAVDGAGRADRLPGSGSDRGR